MARLLALDQASAVSGWAVFNGNQLEAYGKIETHYENLGARLCYIRKEIIKLIHTYNINEIAFENIQMQNNVANVLTFKALAEVYGVVEELCHEMNISYIIVPSVSWKSTLGIKGKGRVQQKQNAQQWVLDNYKLSATQDTVDAICIGTHVIKTNHNGLINPESKSEVIYPDGDKGAF